MIARPPTLPAQGPATPEARRAGHELIEDVVRRAQAPLVEMIGRLREENAQLRDRVERFLELHSRCAPRKAVLQRLAEQCMHVVETDCVIRAMALLHREAALWLTGLPNLRCPVHVLALLAELDRDGSVRREIEAAGVDMKCLHEPNPEVTRIAMCLHIYSKGVRLVDAWAIALKLFRQVLIAYGVPRGLAQKSWLKHLRRPAQVGAGA